MFTGLVVERGTIDRLDRHGDGARLTVRCDRVLDGVSRGDSLAVSGVCLTVAEFDSESFTADVMSVTLEVSTLGAARVGDEVNLEPAVAAGARLGGHIVQGHIDGTADVLAVTATDSARIVRFGLDAELAPLVARKGSIALNGVSLTVSDVGRDTGALGALRSAADRDATGHPTTGDWFEVSLIPETLAVTNLSTMEPGDRVNVETDILARHVQRLLACGSLGNIAGTVPVNNRCAVPAAQTEDAQ